MATPFLGRHELLDPVREEQQANSVVVLDRRHCDHRRDLCRCLGLEAAPRTELCRTRQVDSEENRELTLLRVFLYEWMSHAGGDVPIDGAEVIARRVLAHLGELHPLALKDRLVFAAEQRVDQSARPQLDQLDLTQDLSRNSFSGQ